MTPFKRDRLGQLIVSHGAIERIPWGIYFVVINNIVFAESGCISQGTDSNILCSGTQSADQQPLATRGFRVEAIPKRTTSDGRDICTNSRAAVKYVVAGLSTLLRDGLLIIYVHY